MKKITAVIAAALLLSGCSTEEIVNKAAETAVNISTNIGEDAETSAEDTVSQENASTAAEQSAAAENAASEALNEQPTFETEINADGQKVVHIHATDDMLTAEQKAARDDFNNSLKQYNNEYDSEALKKKAEEIKEEDPGYVQAQKEREMIEKAKNGESIMRDINLVNGMEGNN